MAAEEYDILLWILGERVTQFNVIALGLLVAWSVISASYHVAERMWDYLDYRMDITFWKDTLLPDGPDDQPHTNDGQSIRSNSFFN